MEKRVVVLFCTMMLCMVICIFSVFTRSNGTVLAQTARAQGSYKLSVAKTRGTIYDSQMRPLTDGGEVYRAAVEPCLESAAALASVLPQPEMDAAYTLLQQNKPFSIALPALINAHGMDVFTLRGRNPSPQPAAHTIGYLDGAGNGVSGIEKAFNDVLAANPGRVSVTYRVDALDRVLSGESRSVEDGSYLRKAGVVLTLDSTVQGIAQAAAAKHLTAGAVVITEVPSCEIRALVSLPDFSPSDVSASLDAPGAPLLNRCLSAYSIGSVFKVVSAAAALEYGLPQETEYTCAGSIAVDGLEFHCYNSESHGSQNMRLGISNSCNAYFVNLMQQVPPARFLLTAQSLGFGQAAPLAPGLAPVAGNLPGLREAQQPRALANLSFGQGSLSATPLQISAMLNAVAANGQYTAPSLYVGTVDANLGRVSSADAPETRAAMSGQTAALLRGFMGESVLSGTSRPGAPTHLSAGAKTATAQTGRFNAEGAEEVESWLAGFYPLQSPRYVVTVLGEGGTGGGATCGPVFKEICDGLFEAGLIPQNDGVARD